MPELRFQPPPTYHISDDAGDGHCTDGCCGTEVTRSTDDDGVDDDDDPTNPAIGIVVVRVGAMRAG